MVIQTRRFGPLQADEMNILIFRDGLPGIEKSRKYILVQDPDSAPLEWLQSAEEPDIVLPVIRTFDIFPNYDVELPDAEISGLNVGDISDLLILSVVVIPAESVEKMTANLIAPIVVNMSNGAAKQIIIDAKNYSVRQPVFEALMAYVKGGVA